MSPAGMMMGCCCGSACYGPFRVSVHGYHQQPTEITEIDNMLSYMDTQYEDVVNAGVIAGALTSAALEDINVLLIYQPINYYLASEMSALADWLDSSRCRRLLVIAERTYTGVSADIANDLMSGISMSCFLGDRYRSNPLSNCVLLDHPLAADISGSVMGVDASVISYAGNAVAIATTGDGVAVVGVEDDIGMMNIGEWVITGGSRICFSDVALTENAIAYTMSLSNLQYYRSFLLLVNCCTKWYRHR